MTGAHLHLVLNHIPILGTLFGLILLFLGVSKGNRTLQKAGLATFIVVALICIPVFLTGEPAEHLAEKFPGFSHDLAHEHEELGEKGLILSILLGVISAILLFLINRNKHLNYKKGLWGVMALSVISFLLMVLIGNHGGKIRRPEMRNQVEKRTENHMNQKEFEED
jgi:uncharacterized membrane protein